MSLAKGVIGKLGQLKGWRVALQKGGKNIWSNMPIHRAVYMHTKKEKKERKKERKKEGKEKKECQYFHQVELDNTYVDGIT